MTEQQDETDLEITAEQVEILRELGVPPADIEDMSMADANQLIDELRAEREAGRGV